MWEFGSGKQNMARDKDSINHPGWNTSVLGAGVTENVALRTFLQLPFLSDSGIEKLKFAHPALGYKENPVALDDNLCFILLQ